VIFGALNGLQNSYSLARSAVSGLAFGVLLGSMMTALIWWRTRAVRTSSRADRRQVMRLVQKGQPVTDPHLAQGVIDYVAVIRRAQGKGRSLPWMSGGFTLLAVIILIVALVSGHPAAIAADVFVLAIWVFNWFWLPKQRARVLERATKAESEARQLLPAPVWPDNA
jgi:Flp pilus assembly protein TadB